MTVSELIARLNELGVTGDETIAIDAFGGLSAMCKPVQDVSLGFDWNAGKVMLHPKFPLILKSEYDAIKSRERELRKQAAEEKKRGGRK